MPYVNEVQVIPGLPDPNNGRIYKLQVGSFYSEAGAALAYQQLMMAGFSPAYEYSYNVYRVLAVGIPAANVAYSVQRLGSMGFRQIWVRE
jgi:cell division protein FtsN